MANRSLKTRTSAGLPTRKRQLPQRLRERFAVDRAIKAAIERIARHDPELGEILKSEIKTGEFLAYMRKGK